MINLEFQNNFFFNNFFEILRISILIDDDIMRFVVENQELKEKTYQIEFSIKEGVRILIEECEHDFNRMIERIKIDS